MQLKVCTHIQQQEAVFEILKRHCSVYIKTIILANVLFNSGDVHINFKIYLTEISLSILNLLGIFSRRLLKETFKIGPISRPNFCNVSDLQQ